MNLEYIQSNKSWITKILWFIMSFNCYAYNRQNTIFNGIILPVVWPPQGWDLDGDVSHNDAAEEVKVSKTTEIKLGFSREDFQWGSPDRRAFISEEHNNIAPERAYLHEAMELALVHIDGAFQEGTEDKI